MEVNNDKRVRHIGGTLNASQKHKWFYICDRKKCENCSPECHHTLDEEHAKYEVHDRFVPDKWYNYWEVKD